MAQRRALYVTVTCSPGGHARCCASPGTVAPCLSSRILQTMPLESGPTFGAPFRTTRRSGWRRRLRPVHLWVGIPKADAIDVCPSDEAAAGHSQTAMATWKHTGTRVGYDTYTA
eukprot:3616661-Prymnesium_polylepis.1